METGAPKLIPIDLYDIQRAKWEANIKWLLAKTDSDKFILNPVDIFFESNEGNLRLNPVVEAGLVSSELYWEAYSKNFGDSGHKGLGHEGVIQLLLRRGFSLEGDFDDIHELTDLLKQSSPVHHASHILLIDAFMSVYSSSVATVERVVQAVRKFTTFSASSELPSSAEDSLLFWLNKCTAMFLNRLRSPPQFDAALTSLQDLGDGRALFSAISFYRPNDLPADALSSSTDVADSLHNLVLVVHFCRRLSMPITHLTLNDLFYSVNELLPNIIAFIADLFHCLESLGFDNFQPADVRVIPGSLSTVAAADVRVMQGSTSTVAVTSAISKPPVVVPAISETTKRSFHHVTPGGSTQSVDTSFKPAHPSSAGIARHPLLPKRQIRSASATDQNDVVSDIPKCRDAWGSRPQTRADMESPVSGASLLSNVSIDASLDFDATDGHQPWDSGSLCASARYTESISETDVINCAHTSGVPAPADDQLMRPLSSSYVVEPLQPARLRPAKEKSITDTKRLESGEIAEKSHNMRRAANDIDGDSDSTTPSDGYKTPLSASPQREMSTPLTNQKFVYGSQLSAPSELNQSYTIEKLQKTPGSVPTSGRLVAHHRGFIIDGSDDRELLKHRTDAANKEGGKTESDLVPDEINLGNENSTRTSFAKLRKWKERNIESGNSPLIYEQQQNPVGQSTMSKSVYVEHPAQMTWMEAARIQRSASERNIMKAVDRAPESPVVLPNSEMAGLRMKLEQRRRQIEQGKRRNEQQRSQMLHQMGQDVFVQMIRKKDKRSDIVQNTEVPTDKVTIKMAVPDDVVSSSSSFELSNRRKQTLYKSEGNGVSQAVTPKPAAIVDTENVNSTKMSTQNFARVQQAKKPVTLDSNRMSQNVKVESVRSVPVAEMRGSIAAGVDNHTPVLSATRRSSAGFQQRSTAADNARRSSSMTQSESEGHTILTSPSMTGSYHAPGSQFAVRRLHNDLDSFDRLSSSLSDLQAEITRLTVQQDEIKNLVSSGGIGPTTSISDRDKFYLYPSNDPASRRSPDVRLRPPLGGQIDPYLQDMAMPQTPYSQQPVSGYEVDPRFYVPPYGPYGPQPYISPPHVATHGSYQPPVSQMMHRYPVSTSYMPPYQQPHAGVYQPFHQPQYPGEVAQWTAPDEASFYAATSNVQQSRSPREATALSPSSVGHSEYAADMSSANTSADSSFVEQFVKTVELSSANQHVNQPADSKPTVSLASPPAEISSSRPAQAATFFVDTSPRPKTTTARQNSVSGIVSTPRAECFVINFEPDSVATQPVSNKKTQSESGSDSVNSLPSGLSEPPFIVENTNNSTTLLADMRSSTLLHQNEASAAPISSSSYTVKSVLENEENNTLINAPQPVVFVVGQEQEVDDPPEMEKRRVKLQEQQAKRREEQEQRRLALEMELNRKRENQRIKTEEEERKRNEDKMRRDAIFEKYMRRKKAVDGIPESEMMSSAPAMPLKAAPPAAPVVFRKKSGTSRQGSARPLSQPPPSSGNMMAVVAEKGVEIGKHLGSHGSDDSLLDAEAMACLTRGSNQLNSTPDIRQAVMNQLSYGGLTHRRPQTPERSSPAVQQDSGSSNNSLCPDSYSGPKLYVKPSQKSNRFITINAISHCCLAGVVNKENKEKVLEEIAKSTAVQFIILFRDAGMQYRGLYTYNPDDTSGGEIILTKIHGTGPSKLSSRVMEKFFKYNSGAKSFSEVKSTKHLTATIDAVTVLSSVWQKNRPVAAPTASNRKPV